MVIFGINEAMPNFGKVMVGKIGGVGYTYLRGFVLQTEFDIEN